MPTAAERSPFAHNEVLGALAEGGLLLGLPVLVLFAAALACCTRRLAAEALLRRVDDPLRVAAALSCGGLLVHALVDFGLSFPAILALVAVLLGLCWSNRATVLEASEAVVAAPRGAATAALLVLALCGGYVGLSHDRLGVSGLAAAAVEREPLRGVRDGRDVLADGRALVKEVNPDRDDLRRAEREIARLAPFDGNVETIRVDLLDAMGRSDEARQGARALALRSHERAPLLLLPYAERLAPGDGADLLLVQIYRRAAEVGGVRRQLLELLLAARELAPAQEPGWSCTVRALQDEGALADDAKVVRDARRDITSARCGAWAAQATTLLGDSA